jgi:hypothetical protein
MFSGHRFTLSLSRFAIEEAVSTAGGTDFLCVSKLHLFIQIKLKGVTRCDGL